MGFLNDMFGQRTGVLPPVPPSGAQRYHAANYWLESGWVQRGRTLVGYYRTIVGSFKGEIELSGSGEHRFFIIDPPSQLRHHEHWQCFLYRGAGRYLVHFKVLPANVDVGILKIEQIIREAREQY